MNVWKDFPGILQLKPIFQVSRCFSGWAQIIQGLCNFRINFMNRWQRCRIQEISRWRSQYAARNAHSEFLTIFFEARFILIFSKLMFSELIAKVKKSKHLLSVKNQNIVWINNATIQTDAINKIIKSVILHIRKEFFHSFSSEFEINSELFFGSILEKLTGSFNESDNSKIENKEWQFLTATWFKGMLIYARTWFLRRTCCKSDCKRSWRMNHKLKFSNSESRVLTIWHPQN